MKRVPITGRSSPVWLERSTVGGLGTGKLEPMSAGVSLRPLARPPVEGSRVQTHWESRRIPIYGGLEYTATLKTSICNMQSSILTREDSSGSTFDCGKSGRKS